MSLENNGPRGMTVDPGVKPKDDHEFGHIIIARVQGEGEGDVA